MRTAGLLFALVCALFAVAFAIGCVASWRRALAMERRGVATMGRVVRHREDEDSTYLVVQHQVAGRVYEWVDSDTSRPKVLPPVGATVPVRYLPEDPAQASLDIASRWQRVIVFGVLAVVMGAIAGAIGAALLGG